MKMSRLQSLSGTTVGSLCSNQKEPSISANTRLLALLDLSRIEVYDSLFPAPLTICRK